MVASQPAMRRQQSLGLLIWLLWMLAVHSAAFPAAPAVQGTQAAAVPLQFDFSNGAVAELGNEVLQQLIEVSRFYGGIAELAEALEGEPDIVSRWLA
jgi:hypothetical protein